MNRAALVALVGFVFNSFVSLSSIWEMDQFRKIYSRVSNSPKVATVEKKAAALGRVLKVDVLPQSFSKIFQPDNTSLEQDLNQALFDYRLDFFTRKTLEVKENTAHFSIGGKAKALMALLWINTLKMPSEHTFALLLFSDSFEKLEGDKKNEVLKKALINYQSGLDKLRQNQNGMEQEQSPFSLLSDLTFPCDNYTKILFNTLRTAQNHMIHRYPYVPSNKMEYVFPHGFIINPLSNSRIESPGMLTDFPTLFVVDDSRHPLDIGYMYLEYYKEPPAVLYADSPFVPEAQKGPLERETLRRSTLCLTLDSVFKVSKQETGDFIPKTGAIYHQTIVFRSDYPSGHQYLGIPFQVGLIISEPLQIVKAHSQSLGITETYPEGYQKNTKEKIRTQLCAALMNKHKDIILSPFGCADFFQNDPLVVADLYKQVFLESQFKGKFRSVIFSTLDMLPGVATLFKENIECLNARSRAYLPQGFEVEWKAETGF